MKKGFDCPNSVFKVNIWFKQIAKCQILFRYKDKDNYFAVELNGKGAPLKLIKSKEAELSELAKVTKISMLPEIWYRFIVYYNNEDIQIYYQLGNVRQKFLLIREHDPDAFRGKVGIAVDNNDGTIFDGLATEEPNSLTVEKGSNYEKKYSYGMCAGGDKEAKRKKFCETFYGGFELGIKKCIEMHSFCSICCKKFFNPLENIVNFACQRNCIKLAKNPA